MWTNITIIIIIISLLFHILTRVFKPNFKSNFTKMYDTLYVVARPSRFKCHLNYLPSSQHCLFFSSSSCFLHHSSCFFIPRRCNTLHSRKSGLVCVCVCVFVRPDFMFVMYATVCMRVCGCVFLQVCMFRCVEDHASLPEPVAVMWCDVCDKGQVVLAV